ncbi:MAG TPA: Wzz/FepE/Etk N-terminal domain-containing protein [Puia sp.]|nr:Wzz/FepE/Etk N-terminal domain-containing protein [Puia sp.]
MEFTYLFRALFRRKWIIILCVFVAVGVAFVFTMKTKRLYESTAQFSTGFTVSEEIKLSNENFNLPQIDLKFNNVIENITSPKVLTLVSYRLMVHDLESKAPFTNPVNRQKIQSALQQVNQQRAIEILTAKLDSVEILNSSVPEEKKLINYIALFNYDVESLSDMIHVTRFQRTDYVNITCDSENPYLSSFIVNELLDEFKRFYELDKRLRSNAPLAVLDSISKQKKIALDQKSLEKARYMSSAGVVDVNMEGSNALSQINSFENQLIEERSTYQNVSYRVEQLGNLIRTAKEKGLNTVAAPAALTSSKDRSEYTNLRRQYNELYSDYIQKGGKDPDTKKKLDNMVQSMSKLNLADSITTIQPAENGEVTLSQLIQKKIDADAQLLASSQKIGSIEARLKDLNGGLTGMAAKGASIQQLDKEIELASAEYRDAKEKLNQALNMNETIPGNFKQTLYGQPAIKPQSSKRILIIALAAIIALFISCLSIILIEFFDQSIKTPSHFSRVTNLPVLGLVNWVQFQSSNILERVTDENELRTNIFRELLRKLRYEIETSKKKVFLFTSTQARQGKTSLIQALAYSLSLGKKRVLIIDTNFCNNDLTKSINANPVLEKFSLNGKPFESKDIQEYITKTLVEGVDIIGCEGGDYTPTEILPKNHLLNYIDRLKDEYDCIFMEGAPLNSFTDTKELLQYADTLIAIFAAETVLTAADKESIVFLKENKEKFLGAILNKVSNANLEM